MFFFGSNEILQTPRRLIFFFPPDWAKEIIKSIAVLIMHLFVNTVSQTDCYVKLWLPTASCREARTRTVRNCRNPVWNETFHFMIQREVKVGSAPVAASRRFLQGTSSPAVCRLFMRALRLTQRFELSYAEE